MLKKHLLRAAAWLEILTGLALIVDPDIVSRLLFAAPLDGIAGPLARYSGIAVLALGTACLPVAAAHARRAALGLLIYNVGAVILFLWVWIGTTYHGTLLWPVMILHAGIAAGLLAQLINKDSVST
jgi:hypothetical protein